MENNQQLLLVPIAVSLDLLTGFPVCRVRAPWHPDFEDIKDRGVVQHFAVQDTSQNLVEKMLYNHNCEIKYTNMEDEELSVVPVWSCQKCFGKGEFLSEMVNKEGVRIPCHSCNETGLEVPLYNSAEL